MMKWHDMPDMSKKEEMPFIPIVVSLIVIIGWAFFMLLHVLFWSEDYNLFQNIVILILSLIIVGCGLGILWMYWVRHEPRMHDKTASTANLQSA